MSSEKGRSKASTANTAGARGILTTTKERVAEILEATDRAAGEIMEAANKESEQLVRDTHLRAERLATERMERISNLTEGVMAKADTLDHELDNLRKLIDTSVTALAKDLGLDAKPEPQPVGQKPQPAAPAKAAASPAGNGKTSDKSAEKSAKAAKDSKQADDDTPTSDEDRADALQLLATQLLISGETFESASRRMAEEFGVENPRFVLDSLDFKAIGR